MTRRSPRHTPGRSLARFAEASEAVAAVEFALILPVMLALMLGGMELARFVAVSGKVYGLASSLAALAAGKMNTTDGKPASMSWDDIRFVESSAPVVFPELLQDAVRNNQAWAAGVSMTMSSVQFTPVVPTCTTNCVYTALVAWSAGQAKRPCIIPQRPVASTATPSPSTLSQDVFTAGSSIVADVVYTYTPTFGSAFINPITIRRTAYSQPRYVKAILYKINGNDPGNTTCPGFPTAS